MATRYFLAVPGAQQMYVQYCWLVDMKFEMHLTNDLFHAASYTTEVAAEQARVSLPIAGVVQVAVADVVFN